MEGEGAAAEVESRCSETCLRPVERVDFEDDDPDTQVWQAGLATWQIARQSGLI